MKTAPALFKSLLVVVLLLTGLAGAIYAGNVNPSGGGGGSSGASPAATAVLSGGTATISNGSITAKSIMLCSDLTAAAIPITCSATASQLVITCSGCTTDTVAWAVLGVLP